MNPLQMLSALQKAQNPMVLLNQLSGQNPQLKRVIEVMNGKSPQELEQYVNSLGSNGKSFLSKMKEIEQKYK